MKKRSVIFIIFFMIIFLAFTIYVNKNNILRQFYPTEYNEYVEKYCKEYNVDKYLIYATIKAESNFNSDALSSKGAKGLMQLMDSTAKDIAKELKIEIDNDDLFEPEISINLGAKYISKLINKYNNYGLALAAYNAGSGNVDNWIKNNILKDDGSNIENIPFKETNNYVRKILNDYKIYLSIWERFLRYAITFKDL